MAEEYSGNSNKIREQKPREESVVSHKAERHKRGKLRQIWDFFIGEDSNDLRSYILAVSDIICNLNDAVNLLSGKPVAPRSDLPAAHVAYRKYYKDNEPRISKARTPYYSYDDVSYATLGDAEVVKARMIEILKQYEVVRVSDFLELSGEKTEYPDFSYGWTDLSDMRTVRRNDGRYMLQMPRANPL